ncbi:MAG: AI-2E family transporter [Caldilineaceae bacterium]|nr:AI-2E family transporter [Caldilineaceae bacterium]
MRRIAVTTAGILATITMLFVMWQLSNIVVLFIISLAIAAMVRGPTEYLIRRGWKRWLALLAVYLVGLAVPVALLALVGWRTVNESDPLLNSLISGYVQLYTVLQSGGGGLASLAERLPPPTSLTALLTDEQSEAFIAAVVKITAQAGNVFSQLLIAIVVSIYWTADRLRFERVWLSLLPSEARAVARNRWRTLESGVGAYLRSELTQSILAGLILALGYWMMGIRYPVLLAFAAAVAWFIPLVGGVVGVALVAVFGATVNPLVGVIASAFSLVVFLFLEFYVEPKLYTHERYWRVLALVVMIAMTDAFGLIGLLAAPPLATALQLWINDLLTPLPVAVDTRPVFDFSAVHAKMEETRALLQESNEGASPRLANLFSRLEELVKDVEEIKA